MKTAASTEIGRPVEEVWAFIADPANNPKWDPGTRAVRQTSDGPIRVGTTLVATVELLGRRDLDVRIIGFEPERSLSFEFVSGPVTKNPGALRRGLRRCLPDQADAVVRAGPNGAWRCPLAAGCLLGEAA